MTKIKTNPEVIEVDQPVVDPSVENAVPEIPTEDLSDVEELQEHGISDEGSDIPDLLLDLIESEIDLTESKIDLMTKSIDQKTDGDLIEGDDISVVAPSVKTKTPVEEIPKTDPAPYEEEPEKLHSDDFYAEAFKMKDLELKRLQRQFDEYKATVAVKEVDYQLLEALKERNLKLKKALAEIQEK